MTSRRDLKRKLELDLNYAHSTLDASLATIAIIRAWLNEPTEVTSAGIKRADDCVKQLASYLGNVRSNVSSFGYTLAELKADVAPPFFVTVSRPDVIEALRAAGIDVEVM